MTKKTSERVNFKPMENQIIVLSLNYRTTADDLYKAFSQYGKIVDLHLLVNNNNESKGYGFISYETHSAAQNAIQRMNGQRFEGKPLKVTWAADDDREKIKKVSKKRVKMEITIKIWLSVIC